jgi:hypothetical protein
MYINLLLGAVAVAGLIMLLHRLLVRPAGQEEDPAALLGKELEERRRRAEATEQFWEQAQRYAAEQLSPVAEALSAMQPLMAEKSREGRLEWDEKDGRLCVRIHRNAGTEHPREIVIHWRMPDMDMRAAPSAGNAAFRGVFTVCDGGGRETSYPDRAAFLHFLAVAIADEIAGRGDA